LSVHVPSYINPANAVTASRFLTLPPFVYFIDRGMYQWALLTALVCGLLDILDGWVAKVFDCRSGFGELFDAIADAVCYGFFMFILVLYGRVPWVPVVAILAMGMINMAFRGVYVRRVGKTTNYRSFAMERIVAYAAYLSGIGVAGYEVEYFYYLCALLMAVVVVHDAKRMLLDPVPA
jgi:cardiolipin synthase (CMP-forming)